MQNNRLAEWLSVRLTKNPSGIVLLSILLFNFAFLLIAAKMVSSFSLTGTEHMSFFEAAFCTITMILDPGCISYVIDDIGHAGVAITIICLFIILVGMIFFTGTVIGYITNYISSFISPETSNKRKLSLSGHVVILNWNARAAEIINDLLFCNTPQTVVVMVENRKIEIEKEIGERIANTIETNNSFTNSPDHRLKRNITTIVREGDVFSSKQLKDISVDRARLVIILENEDHDSDLGNSHTVKTLMQVSDITGSDRSADDQKVIVEITDDWTGELVDKIIRHKEKAGKSRIIPLYVNSILGQLMSQITVMPELNLVYRELFSNRGLTLFGSETTHPVKTYDERISLVRDYMKTHCHSIPLSSISTIDGSNFFFAAEEEFDTHKTAVASEDDSFEVKLHKDFWLEPRNIIILGHNSRCLDLMKGFTAFSREWNIDDIKKILRVKVLDEKSSLEKLDYYNDFPFVEEVVEAGIFDKELISREVEDFIDTCNDTCKILILSDDTKTDEPVDSGALANLIFIQDIIDAKKRHDPYFDDTNIDMIVEIIDPKHNDIIRKYDVNNVVISNRYISKIITQIGEKDILFDFYSDILTYSRTNSLLDSSNEIYAKKVYRYYESTPSPCTAAELIKATFEASVDPSIPIEEQNPAIVLGYVKPTGEIHLFKGDLRTVNVALEDNDRVILYTNH